MSCDPTLPSSYDVRRFGALGDGQTLTTAALQQALDTCAADGGGTVVVPAGTYLTGTLYLRSHVTLHLCAGATLLGSPRPEDYNPDDVFPENRVFAIEKVSGAHLIIAYRQEHVAITGEGTIDGNSAAFFEALPEEEITRSYRRKSRNFPFRGWRPGQMVFFCRCTDVAVRDVTLRNAPYWTLFLHGCRWVQVRGLHITNPPQTANGDGIDLDCCQEVTVSDCLIESGDDCITLRANAAPLGEAAQDCANVVVTNCVLSTPCNAMRIGVGDGVVRDCTCSNIIIKEARTGLSIVACYSERSAHGARLENLHFAHCVMDTMMPINLQLGPHAKPPATIRNLSFSHFHLLARQGCYFGGNPGHPVQDLRLHEVDLRLTEGDVNPSFQAAQAHPGGGANGIPSGLLASYVDGLRVDGLRVRWEDDAVADWQYAAEIEHSTNVALERVEATPPPHFAERDAVRYEG
ncbi:right-handed parallel beta-helix repeat-containing protein [bacterium]|nr:right-handed parallel beta-helix repeat-containing protein [bacterium]